MHNSKSIRSLLSNIFWKCNNIILSYDLTIQTWLLIIQDYHKDLSYKELVGYSKGIIQKGH